MMSKQILVLCGAAFFGGIVGGGLSSQFLFSGSAEAQKPNGIHAEEFLLLDAKGELVPAWGWTRTAKLGSCFGAKTAAVP